MNLWIFLKLFGDVCAYFLVVSALPALFPYGFSFLMAALLCGAGGEMAAFAAKRGRNGLRFLGLLLPAFALALAGSVTEALILLPAAAYTAMVIIRGEFALEYYSVRQFFLGSLIPLGGFLVVIMLLQTFEGVTAPLRTSFHAEAGLLCGAFYALAEVFLLRSLRMGGVNGARENGLNAVQMTVVLGGIGVSCAGLTAVSHLLRERGTSILRALVWAGLTVFSAVVEWIRSLFQGLDREILEVIETTAPVQETFSTVPLPVGEAVPPVERPLDQGEPFAWWIVLLLLGSLLALWYMRKLFRAQGAVKRQDETVEAIMPPKREEKRPKGSNREKVRGCYRMFLKGEKRRGMKLLTSQTSLDILREVSKDTDDQAAARLRAVYLRARYDERHTVSPTEVKEAKAALKKSHRA